MKMSVITRSILAMPVSTGWKRYTHIDKMTDGESKIFYTVYVIGDKLFVLIYSCEENVFGLAFQGKGALGEYEDDSLNNEFLIRFDKEPPYNISNVFKTYGDLFLIHHDRNFLSKIKKHQTLFVDIRFWPDDYVIVEFDISGFDEIYDSHCG